MHPAIPGVWFVSFLLRLVSCRREAATKNKHLGCGLQVRPTLDLEKSQLFLSLKFDFVPHNGEYNQTKEACL
ncbi:MAG: hypothetical protein LBC26_06145 [Oscillospiraceae bacterium]|jgi:hypothetical protein|nr:hypothetical protein [Oscillospiraceae bacterium]